MQPPPSRGADAWPRLLWPRGMHQAGALTGVALGLVENTAREFGVGRFMSPCLEQNNCTARRCLAGCTNEAASGHGSRAAQGQGPIGMHDSGDDASLQGGARPCTAGPIKYGSQSPPSSSSSSLFVLGSISACACCSASSVCHSTHSLSIPFFRSLESLHSPSGSAYSICLSLDL